MKDFQNDYPLIFPDRSCRLHTMFAGCGHECVVNTAYNWNSMQRGNREFVVWQYTIAGRGALDINGRTFDLLPGNSFLALIPEKSCYYLPQDSRGWEFLFMTITGSEAARIAGECRSRSGPVFPTPEDSEVVQFARRILDWSSKGILNDCYSTSSAAYRFMMLLLKNAEELRSGNDDKLIQLVHDYSLKNIHRTVPVTELAELAGLSRWHFSRCFRQAAGQSPHDYINALKMRLAVRLLQSGREPVKEIASRCGFDDTSYFCKVFKKTHGVAPSLFRTGTCAEDPEK